MTPKDTVLDYELVRANAPLIVDTLDRYEPVAARIART